MIKDFLFKYVFFIVLIGLATTSNAQMFESIKVSLKHKPSLYATYDGRGSFISNRIAQVKSVKLGVTYNKQFTLALGYNWLKSDFNTNVNEITPAKLRLQYISPYVEYSFLEHKNIEVTIPVILGFGRSFYKGEDQLLYNTGFICTYEPSMTATYRFLKYFGIGGGIGYRILLVGNRKIIEQFNSPTYTFKFKLFFGDIYKDVKGYLTK